MKLGNLDEVCGRVLGRCGVCIFGILEFEDMRKLKIFERNRYSSM